jgi:hypothetical protein
MRESLPGEQASEYILKLCCESRAPHVIGFTLNSMTKMAI